MKGFAKRGSRGEKGFTLVELLIVFTLLGVLAAIMIPNVSNLIDYGHDQAALAEKSIVQTAMDTMMAKTNSATVNESATTNDMATFPAALGDTEFLYPNYMRFPTTKGSYSCDDTGLVAQD